MADPTLAYLRKALNWHAGRVMIQQPDSGGMGRYDARANAGERILSDDEIQSYGR